MIMHRDSPARDLAGVLIPWQARELPHESEPELAGIGMRGVPECAGLQRTGGGMEMFHIRLHGNAIALLKHRATAAGASPADYVETVLWYAGLHNDTAGEGTVAPESDRDEWIYFSAPLSMPLRRHMITRSEEHRLNLSAYAGILVERYLAAFERDPGDLRLLARLNQLLQQEDPVTENSLLTALHLAMDGPVSRMPSAYQARWLHQRLAPFLSRIDREGTEVKWTVACAAGLLKRRE
jgi:hypothetical protein